MRITRVEPTELFTGTAGRPLQIVRVTLAGAGTGDGGSTGGSPGTPLTVRIEGPAVRTPRPAAAAGPGPGAEQTVEVGVELPAPVTEGSSRRATVIAEATGAAAGTGHSSARAEAEIIAAVPGWTMWMVSHFHYDPVWWNTQAQFTESRLLLPDDSGKMPEFRTAFELVGLHLDMAAQDPDYKFVLAEIDYLKPYFDTHPERRPELKRLISEGRVEIVGGSYNEPNTNLTCAESTIRNAVLGIGYQRDVLGGNPATAWMLDVFGHDPSYPSLMADAGLTSSAWARGPFHQWGPKGTVGDNARMQFPSEFEWMSPDGSGLLTAYMANHYGAGWVMHSRGSLESAERAAYAQFQLLKPVAATRNVLLPVGADHVIPCRWAAPVHRDWNTRYVWPKFVTALPSEFFAAVRADAAARGIAFTTQTRDMNPVYPGKDVSYIDTKQGQRAAETAVMDGERLATLAWLHGAAYPHAALDKAWRQLVYGAHHDAITGTESDQVYLDLLGGWREAYERGDTARRAAAAHLAAAVDTTATTATTGAPAPVRSPAAVPGADPAVDPGAPDRAIVVFNTLATARDGLVTITLTCPRPGTGWLELRDGAAPVPALAEGVRRHHDGTLAEVTLTFTATAVPGLGYRTYWAHPLRGAAAERAGTAGWSAAGAMAIENSVYRAEADPRRGGTLTHIVDKRTGIDYVAPGGLANELVIQDEYDYHPRWNEGPWLLMPKGAGTGSAAAAASVVAQRCPIGARLVASFAMDDLRITQETLLWDGAAQIGFRTHVDGSIGHDRLLRVRFPLNVPGGLPVYETAAAVIGRPFGPVDTDVGKDWFTLDNPAYTWFGLGSAARVIVRDTAGGTQQVAIGVAEVITPGTPAAKSPNGCREVTRRLIAALARCGVTATCSAADGPRYGAIDLDSNLPDVRIALGGPDVNSFTAEVLAAADPAYGKELARRLDAGAMAVIWVPATQSRAAAFVPGADVRGARDLPVLIVCDQQGRRGRGGVDLERAAGAVIESLAAAGIEAVTPAGVAGVPPAGVPADAPLAGWSAALLNRGTPGCVAATDGSLNISLMRSCSGWPSGVWIDEPKRAAPDGSSFSWQHWSHTFEYALVSTGAAESDWRDAGFVAAGQAYNHPLLGCETGIHGGPLPAASSLFPIEPVTGGPADGASGGGGGVVLTALKPRRHHPGPDPAGPGPAGLPGGEHPGGRAPIRAGWLTVRLREPDGRPARVRLRPATWPRWAGQPDGTAMPPLSRVTNLLEEHDGTPLEVSGSGDVTAAVPPSGMVTLAITDARAGQYHAGAPQPVTQPATEPAQPVYTRYWLHGKGPAPAGNLPVAVHVSPGRAAIAADGAARLRVTVSAGREPAAGTVDLHVPDGLAADVTSGDAGLRYDLPGDGHAAWDVTVRPAPGGTPAGRYFLAARISEGAGTTGEAGQVFEDVATIAVGEQPLPPRDTPLGQFLPLLEADEKATAAELDITGPAGDITLAPGERGELVVRLANRSRSQIRGEAQLVSPFGTWEAIAPWTRGFAVEPGAEVTARYDVLAPAAARPGAQWWALVKVCYFGRVRYTSAIRVSISD